MHVNMLNSYDVVCNYNIESKREPEKSDLFYYYMLASLSIGLTECILFDN